MKHAKLTTLITLLFVAFFASSTAFADLAWVEEDIAAATHVVCSEITCAIPLTGAGDQIVSPTVALNGIDRTVFNIINTTTATAAYNGGYGNVKLSDYAADMVPASSSTANWTIDVYGSPTIRAGTYAYNLIQQITSLGITTVDTSDMGAIFVVANHTNAATDSAHLLCAGSYDIEVQARLTQKLFHD